jgi:putative lipase involved disintegration of autophagic bodies
VYDDEGVVIFETTHLSVFGLSVERGSGSTVEDEASDSLGGGCFIGSLFPTAAGERP